MKKMRISVAILAALLITWTCGSDKTPWLYKIEGKSVTLKQLDEAYKGFLFVMRMQLQQGSQKLVTEEEFNALVEDPEKSGDPRSAEQLKQLGKDNFAKVWKDIMLVNMELQKDGFAKRPDVKAKLEYISKFYLQQLYMEDQLKASDIKIGDADALARWEKIKKENPGAKTFPLDKGLEIGRAQLLTMQYMQKTGEFMENTRQKYRIETNKDFDITEYVKTQREEARKKREQSSTGTPGVTPDPAPVKPPKK